MLASVLVHAIHRPQPGLVAGLVLRPLANHGVPGLVMLHQVERQVGTGCQPAAAAAERQRHRPADVGP
eukprot:4508990-Lingulodinium_polyedra.AAC.1